MRNILFTLLIAAGACSPQFQVYTDHDPQTDVRLYSKFRWLNSDNVEAGNNPLYYNDLNDKRIKSVIAEQLAISGYTFDYDNADVVIHYHIMVKEKGVVYTDNLGYCYSQYWMDERVHLYQYSEGTMIIDIMDAKSSDLIWRGWAVSVLDFETPTGMQKVIKTSIERIFRKFPHSFNLNRTNQNL